MRHLSAGGTVELAQLGPVAQLRAGRLPRRLPQLLVGLVLFGIAHGLMFRAALGLPPWDVLHAGLARHLPITLGQALILVAFLVLAGWIPLREKPGVGTVANAVIIGVVIDVTIDQVSQPDHLLTRAVLLAVGILLAGVATAMYIGAQLGRGPRDGLMTGLHRRTGVSIRVVRTVLEVVVLLVGILLGGSVGLGTLAFAIAIGPLAQFLLPFWIVDLPPFVGDATATRDRSWAETGEPL